MAHPEIIEQKDGVIKFTLSNKPDLVCLIDVADYYKHVHNTTCWSVHSSGHLRVKGVRGKRRVHHYIRMTLNNPTAPWHKHLHREIMGLKSDYTKESVVDHLNSNGLDCRKVNMIHTDVYGNSQNKINRKEPAVPRYRGIPICIVTKKGLKYFQAYKSKVFMGAGKDLNDVKRKIDQKLDQ